ncbi:uncharacterized protein LOC119633779 [Glossina fuscipes]|uniref:Uncharacterized protein LOC119633779 n=1 Tax=Glossina fuscipes TaxID=7396 RepID=A0A8U0WDE6_9MUSC|nr:uncharacterized protein LOC119633779 [Glossina fuscipes]KAI9585164.1 hypothetical protein GQX74_001011 [Glossina fuscipes]
MFNLKFIIVAVILVARYSSAIPIPDANAKPEVFDEEMTARIEQLVKGDYDKDDLSVKDKYILFVIDESKKLYEYFHEQSTKVSEALLADTDVTENEDEDVKEFVKKLHEYLEKAKNADNVEEKLTTLVFFFKLMEQYDADNIKDPSKGVVVADGYLKKHGMEEFGEEFEKRCSEFLKEFIEKAEEVRKDFTEEQLEKYAVFIEILEELKKDLTIESRLDLLFDKVAVDKDHE